MNSQEAAGSTGHSWPRRPASLQHSLPSESDSLPGQGHGSLPGLSPASSSFPPGAPCTPHYPDQAMLLLQVPVPTGQPSPLLCQQGNQGTELLRQEQDSSRARRAALCTEPRVHPSGTGPHKSMLCLREARCSLQGAGVPSGSPRFKRCLGSCLCF